MDRKRYKILFACGILLVALIVIGIAIWMFSKVPNVAEFTPKEGGTMVGGVMLLLVGIGGIIGFFAYIGMMLED